MQNISIAIIGFNEEDGIGRLLDSLQPQTLLKRADDIEIIVVSNGSYDNTVSIATEKLLKFDDLGIRTKVVELALADKCAAWNHFVHEVSKLSDYYIFLDADVVLVNETGLEEMIEILASNPECRICAGKIMSAAGERTGEFVDGKCYAARGDILRNVAIPEGIVMDDAYVAVTIVTNWYETNFEQGMQRGYIQQSNNVIVSCGETKRDKINISYWIACRKRTIIGGYAQRQIDYCMREIFGGGEKAKNISMQLFTSNSSWFFKYLTKEQFNPDFEPLKVSMLFSIKRILKYLLYCYCYILSIKGIKAQEFGHLAWKLKHRYW